MSEISRHVTYSTGKTRQYQLLRTATTRYNLATADTTALHSLRCHARALASRSHVTWIGQSPPSPRKS